MIGITDFKRSHLLSNQLTNIMFPLSGSFLTLLLLSACGGGGSGGGSVVVSGAPADVPEAPEEPEESEAPEEPEVVQIVVTGTSNEENPISGTQENEYFFVAQSESYVLGQGGDDIFDARGTPASGPHHVFGGSGNDFITGSSARDNLAGNDGDDVIWGRDGNDYIEGNDGNDWLFAERGADELFGGKGDAILHSWTGGDRLFGGEGDDRLHYVNTNAQTHLTGGLGADQFIIFASVRELNTRIIIRDFNPEEDLFIASDVFVFSHDDGVNSYFRFGNTASGPVVLTFENYIQESWDGVADSHGLTRYGTAHHSHDIIFATNTDHEIRLGDGNDYAEGMSGQDEIYGEAGNDLIFGHAGNDQIYGGSGNDDLIGGQGHDELYGGAGNDALDGNDGADLLFGEAGNDRLYGGNGDDIINGGAGNDFIVGDSGDDRLTGGAGADIFSFHYDLGISTNGDVITDFEIGIDKIELDSRSDVSDEYRLVLVNDGRDTAIENISSGQARRVLTLEGVDYTNGLDDIIFTYDAI